MTRERSDYANSETVASPFVYLAIARKGNEYSMHFSHDGKQWQLARHFQLPPEQKLRIGFAMEIKKSGNIFANRINNISEGDDICRTF